MTELEPIKQRYVFYYRSGKRDLARMEKRYLATPTTQLFEALAEQRGYLRGLMRLIELFELRQDDLLLPGIE